MSRQRPPARWVLACLLVLATATPAAAQGNSDQSKHPRGGPPRPGGGPSATTPGSPSPAVASLTTWLDDASLLARNEVWFGVSFARWSTDTTRVIFAPITNVAVGLAPRVSAGVSAPVYHAQDTAGWAHDTGDVSIFGKVGLRDPAKHAIGFALSPIVVVYEEATPLGSSRRAAWALPINVEARATHARVYGSAGYFSNGAVFANGAVEVSLTRAFAVSAVVGGTRSTKEDAVTVERGRHRIDASVSASVTATPWLGFFVSVGRSRSGIPALDGGPWVAGGIMIRRAAPGR